MRRLSELETGEGHLVAAIGDLDGEGEFLGE